MRRLFAGLLMVLWCVAAMAQTDSVAANVKKENAWRVSLGFDGNVLRGPIGHAPLVKDYSNRSDWRLEFSWKFNTRLGAFFAMSKGNNDDIDRDLPPFLEEGASEVVRINNSDFYMQVGAMWYVPVGRRFTIVPMLGIGTGPRMGADAVTTFATNDENTDMVQYYMLQHGASWRMMLSPGCRVVYRCSSIFELFVGVEYRMRLTGSSDVSISITDAYTGTPLAPVYEYRKRTPLMVGLGFGLSLH